MNATIRPEGSVRESTLYVAFELSAKDWKLAMAPRMDVKPYIRTVSAGDVPAVGRACAQARQHFRIAADTPVLSCYEAGRDGFWIDRALRAVGITNRVVDSSSIEVNRRARRAKTDRLDARKLLRMLIRVCGGERDVWREVRVPTREQEAARHVSRERTSLLQERTRLVNQMRGWLATLGCRLPRKRAAQWWTRVRDFADTCLPAEVQQRLARIAARWALLTEQIAALDAQQAETVRAAGSSSALGRLVQLKGVATRSATTLVEEGLVWRDFANRRQVGAFLGFTPTPCDSGATQREQGISRAGNPRVQAVMTQLAWSWIRWQPESAIARWYRERFSRGSTRARLIGIVAVARRLLIALWRYATTAVVPTGAVLKTT